MRTLRAAARRGTRQVCALHHLTCTLRGAARRAPSRPRRCPRGTRARRCAAAARPARESPERSLAPQPRPHRAACSTPCMVRCHAGTQQCAPAERATRPKGQSVAPADCAGPTAKRMGTVTCPKRHVAHGPGVLCAPTSEMRTEQLGPSLRGKLGTHATLARAAAATPRPRRTTELSPAGLQTMALVRTHSAGRIVARHPASLTAVVFDACAITSHSSPRLKCSARRGTRSSRAT